MASTEQQLRRELHDEREQLAEAVGTLRAKLRSKLPLVTAGALGLGFVASGGMMQIALRKPRSWPCSQASPRSSAIDHSWNAWTSSVSSRGRSPPVRSRNSPWIRTRPPRDLGRAHAAASIQVATACSAA